MKILFITVGTSALTAQRLWSNLRSTEEKARRELIEGYQKPKARQLQEDYEADNDLFATVLDAHRHWWNHWGSDSDRLATSAEMSSTSLLLADTKFLAPWDTKDRLVLLLSDTAECDLAGRINAQLMHDIFCQCECGADFACGQVACDRVLLHPVPGMDAIHGFKSLSTELEELIPKLQTGDVSFSFNITGGFKGAVPSITYAAMKPNYLLYYLHETQSAIIDVDFTGRAGFQEKMTVARRYLTPRGVV